MAANSMELLTPMLIDEAWEHYQNASIVVEFTKEEFPKIIEYTVWVTQDKVELPKHLEVVDKRMSKLVTDMNGLGIDWVSVVIDTVKECVFKAVFKIYV